MINLDNLKKLLAAGAPGDWRQAGVDVKTHRHVIATADCWTHSALIVALHNAAPGMIAELEAARAVCEVISLWAGVEMVTLHPDKENIRVLLDQIEQLKAENKRLTAENTRLQAGLAAIHKNLLGGEE